MGALRGEWRINLPISPTTWCFCSIVFAMMLIYYKDPKTPKITQFGALAGQIQHVASQKVGFTPRPIRYGSPNWHFSSCIAYQGWAWKRPLRGAIPWELQKNIHIWASDNPPLVICLLVWTNQTLLSLAAAAAAAVAAAARAAAASVWRFSLHKVASLVLFWSVTRSRTYAGTYVYDYPKAQAPQPLSSMISQSTRFGRQRGGVGPGLGSTWCVSFTVFLPYPLDRM